MDGPLQSSSLRCTGRPGDLSMRTLMRFITLAVFVAGVVAVLVSRALVAQQPAAGDWPQFRGNPQLTGVAASTLPPALKVIWTFDLGETIESSAAIADG